MVDASESQILQAAAAPRKGRVRGGAPVRAHAALLALLPLAFACACGGPRTASGPLTIVARCAPFPNLESAAVAESLVHWTDADRGDEDACTESYAAVELRDLLARCPGIAARTITLKGGDRLPAAGDCIVIGNPNSQPLVRELMKQAPPDSASADAFRIRALRRDGRTVWVIAGATRTGTLYGTYALLERLGVRFYGPADSETVFPREPVVMPARIDMASSPAFDVRGFWAWEPRGNLAFFRWMARRRMNLWTALEPGVPLLRKLGIRLVGGGHSVQSDYLNPNAIDPATHRAYFQEHPEWFGLHDGRRSPNISGESGDNICTSNTAAVSELARNLVRSLASGPLRAADLVNVWPLDGGRWCECEACRALGGPSDRALDLVLRLDDEVQNARHRGELERGVVLSAAAYLETMAPPARPLSLPANDRSMVVTFFPYFRCYAHTLADPACTELNRRIEAAWEGWATAPMRAYGGPVGIGEYYNVSWFKSLPLVFPHVMARDIADYHAAGARLFYYMHVPTSRWGPWRLNHLVMSEALWSPGFNVDSLVADYGARAFPGAAADMGAYYRSLESASANIFAVELAVGGVFGVAGNPEGRLAVRSMPLFQLAHLPYAATERAANAAPAWSEIAADMASARASLERARLAVRDPGARARLEDDDARFTYGERTFALYDRLLLLARADRGELDIDVRAALADADSLASLLESVHGLVQVAGLHSNARNGLEASHVAPALAWFHARFGRGQVRR